MPVLGHAFVGLGIGMVIKPVPRGTSQTSSVEARSPLWLPAIVAVAYLPDVVTQIALLAGWSDGRLLAHSAMFAVTVSPAVALFLKRLAPVSFARGFLVSLLSLVVHDVLDLMQATDRTPWWPLSTRRVVIDLVLLPTDSVRETVMFGALLFTFVALRHVMRPRAARGALDPSLSNKGYAWRVWLGRASIVAIVMMAALTHGLQDVRESELEAGRALIRQGAYQAGLEALARAERWPSTATSGRINYLRAEAYAGMGDRQAAEVHYLRAHWADPGYLWAVADLAALYASSNHPPADRRRLVAPWLKVLCTDFAAHPALPGVLARVERALQMPGLGKTGSSATSDEVGLLRAKTSSCSSR